jgi:hypothetical protein
MVSSYLRFGASGRGFFAPEQRDRYHIAVRALALLVLVTSGCGGALARSEVSGLRSRIDELQRRDTAVQQRVDDLENKVFLLTDQMESRKVAEQQRAAPRLPVITLSSPSASGEAEPAEDGRAEVDPKGTVKASEPDGVRPSLRLHGQHGGRPAASVRRRNRRAGRRSRPLTWKALLKQGPSRDARSDAARLAERWIEDLKREASR